MTGLIPRPRGEWTQDAGPRSRTCSAPGCDKPHKAKGFCNTHHLRAFHRLGGGLDLKSPKRNAVELENGVARLRIDRRDGSTHWALLDEGDLSLVEQFCWSLDRRNPRDAYARASLRLGRRGNEYVRMHSLIMGTKGVDHANGNKLDNRRANLRVATESQNRANRSFPLGRSGYRGVVQAESGMWVAQITVGDRHRYLGRFWEAETAAAAYDAAAREAFGEFARLNFPEPGVPA